MADDKDDLPNFSDPYFFRQLYDTIRQLIEFAASHTAEYIHGEQFLRLTRDHDLLRKLTAWNFLASVSLSALAEYEPGISVRDFEIRYRATRQLREFMALELNNPVDLHRAVLIWLRADSSSVRHQGLSWTSVRTIGFYELVMLLNKPEQTILHAIRALEGMKFLHARLVFQEDGRVWSGSEFEITPAGMLFLDRQPGAAMTFNNINIVGSNVGIVAIESTLTNIDARTRRAEQT